MNKFLSEYVSRLNNVKTQINSFPAWQRALIENNLNITDVESSISRLQQRNATSSTEEEYSQILSSLLQLRVPQSVNVISSGDSLLFFPDRRIIDFSDLENIGGGTYDPTLSEEYLKALYGWQAEHIDFKISYKTYAASIDSETLPLFTSIDASLSQKKDFGDRIYLILEEDDVIFKEDYNEKLRTGYSYIDFGDSSALKTVSFAIPRSVDFESFPIFISPSLNKLELEETIATETCNFDNICDAGENWRMCINDCKPWGLMIVLFIAVLLAGIIVYIMLYYWYQRKYESHLFKNKNMLYNLVVYVHKEKQKQKNDKEIKKELQKVGWSGEQIDYVLRRYAGKPTGMPRLMPTKFPTQKK
jgi:hypothetical protein